MQFIVLWLVSLPIVVAGDILWLGFVMKDFYRAHLGHLMGGIVWPAAVAFYLMYSAGVVYFAVLPGIASGSIAKTIVLAALLGAFAYATYDLTNNATLRDWPLAVTIIDILWGAFLSGVVGAVGFSVARWLA